MPIINRPGSGGADPAPAPNDTQIYYEYIFDGTVIYDTTSTLTQNNTAPAPGYIRANNANTAIATVFAVANQTFNSQGIGTYMDRQAAGLELNLRGVNAQQFGVYNMESAPTSGSGHRKFIVTPVNGLALADQDRIALSFTSTGNVKANPVTGNLEANNVPVAPNILTVDTIAEALSLVTVNAANDRKEFAVLDPGNNASNPFFEPIPWNLLVDNTAGILRQPHGLSEFAINRAVARYRQPAANASGTATTDSTILAGRTRVTVTAHGLTGTGVPTVPSYVINQTAQDGWTALEKIKILSIVDANTLILDKVFSTLTGVNKIPDLFVITETAQIVKINNPVGRSFSELVYKFNLNFPNTAGTKTIVGELNGVQVDGGDPGTDPDPVSTTYWGGASVIFASNRTVTRTINIKNIGDTSAQRSNTTANSNSGVDASGTAAVVESITDMTADNNFTLTMALSAAADYVDVVSVSAAMRW